MKLQAIISSAALAAVLSLSGAAYAQNMIGGVAVPADQMQRFKDACAALQAKSTASLTADDQQGSDSSTAPATDPTTTASVAPNDQTTPSDPAAQDNWDTIMAGLTLEQCNEGGFMAAQ